MINNRLHILNPKGCMILVEGIAVDLAQIRALGCVIYSDLDLLHHKLKEGAITLHISNGTIMKSFDHRTFEAKSHYGNTLDLEEIHSYIADLSS